MTLNMDDLDPEQYQAATAPRGPVCIIAGAGTGKTRTITHRIAYLVDGGFVNPDQVLAVTFTTRAAAELRERLMMMGVAAVQSRTFHSAALKQLSYFWPHFMGDQPKQIVNNKFPLIRKAIEPYKDNPSKEMLKDVLAEIEWAKSSVISPEDYPLLIEKKGRQCPIPVEQFIAVFQRYERIKQAGDTILLDFDDILMAMTGAIEYHPGIAAEFYSRYRSFVVDEYQDVTPLQQRLLDAWLGQRDDITVVGDPNQTIYSFNGADPGFLLGFTRRWSSATVVRLHRDYRSTPQVVDCANEVIAQAKGRIQGSRLALEGQRPPQNPPRVIRYSNDKAEAEGVAQRIKALQESGISLGNIAVIYRSASQSLEIEQALDRAGVFYQVRGGEGFFQKPEIKSAIKALIQVQRKSSSSPLSIVDQTRNALFPLGLTPQEPVGAQERQRWYSLQAVFNFVEDAYRSNPQIDMRGVLALLQERDQNKNPLPGQEAVTLASIHASKGLEWDAVFMVGLYDGMLPIHYALHSSHSEEAIEEERRLLYVGITRARVYLELSWAVSRHADGVGGRVQSRFLEGLSSVQYLNKESL